MQALFNLKMFLIVLACLAFAGCAEHAIEEELPLLSQAPRKAERFQLLVEQNQIARYYISPESNFSQGLPKECHIHPAYISVTSIIESEIPISADQQSYSFNKQQKSLYELSNKRLVRHQVDWIGRTLRKAGTLDFQDQCDKIMAQKWEEDEKSYVFSCDKVYKIATNLSVLGVIKRKQGKFTPSKVVRFQELIFELSGNQGVNIYKMDFEAQIQFIGNINTFNNRSLHIADLFYRNKVLYVLDYKQGPLLYQRKGDQFHEKERITFKFNQEVQFKYIIIEQKSLFVALSKVGESIVVECSFVGERLLLVRYFKGYSSIEKISIFQNKLLIESESKIELLPIGRDPRIINQLNNGYTYTHDNKVKELDFLQDNTFLISSPGKLQIVGWIMKKANIECVFPEVGTYLIKYQAICEKRQGEFYQVCVDEQQLQISVSSSHKDDYFWLLLIVSGVFTIGVVTLILWRNDQNQKINKLIRKIKEYRQRFQPKKETVEFEEVQHAYSVDLKTQSEGFKEAQGGYKQFNQEEVKVEDHQEHEDYVGESQRREFSHG